MAAGIAFIFGVARRLLAGDTWSRPITEFSYRVSLAAKSLLLDLGPYRVLPFFLHGDQQWSRRHCRLGQLDC